jgi:diguanylate cyclase (GGDEF)-like protein
MWSEMHAMALLAAAALGALLGALVARGRVRGHRRGRDGDRSAEAPSRPAATHDEVTGLPSRVVFDTRLSAVLEASEATAQPGCVLYAGLDGFRLVNDRHGHQFGDELLRNVGRRLRETIGGRVLLCRVAGDEFAMWIDARTGDGEATAQRIVAAFEEPFTLQGQSLTVPISLGVALFPQHGARSLIVSRAAAAMRSVKLAGGHAYAVFNPQVAAEEREELQLAKDLRLAVERRQLELYYQPKIDARTLQVTAAEALLRWKHPTRGMINPDEFIPLAERHGLIAEIGAWVLKEALRQAASWRTMGLRMRVAVNVSGYQMRSDDFAQHLERDLQAHGLKASRFTCEITESVAMEDTAVTLRAFERLGALGVHVSIDDFGTGHSSLASLRKLPAEELKIDRAFVTDLDDSAEARHIVGAIVQMAHNLGLRVVAEGVETEAQRDHLVALGCDELQGYLFAKPMSARALGMWAADAAARLTQAFKPSLFGDTHAVLTDELYAQALHDPLLPPR